MATIWQYNGNMSKERTDEERTNLRVPRVMLDRMRWMARADHRSLNAELVVAIKEFLERRERDMQHDMQQAGATER